MRSRHPAPTVAVMTRALSTQIVVRDTATGATVLAPRAAGSNGASMTGEMLSPSVSADGRREPDKLVSRGAGASGAAVPGIWRPAPGTADNDDGGQRLEAVAPA